MHGEVTITRGYWYCRECKHGEFPDDESLGIEMIPHRITRAVKEEAVYLAQNQGSFQQAEYMMKRAYQIDLNRETIREIAQEAGQLAFEQDTLEAEWCIDNIHTIDSDVKMEGTVYIMPDGAAVNTRIEDENGSTWRENKTVIAFSSKDMVKRKNDSNIIVKKEIAPLIGTSEDFKKYALRTAVDAGYGKYKDTVVIADGAAWIRNMSDEIFPDALQILDLYHFKENVHAFSKYVKPERAQAVAWAEMIIDKVENHYAVDEALSCIPEVTKLPDSVPNLRTYIENNRMKLNYPLYRSRGYFVGSGAIESMNKTIVQQRLKRAGMRWGIPGAQAMLVLRAKHESKRWHDVLRVCA